MSRIPRCANGGLDSSAIHKIHLVLDREGFFPEVVVVYTKDLPIIQPVTKKLLDEIVLSGIDYDERKKST